MNRRWIIAAAIAIFAAGATLRTLWLEADPPLIGATDGVGVVWHDEGAWVHNARNKALWGTWRTDEWNPLFIAPVFTTLEFGAFELFGVGTWQARTVSVGAGLVAVAALMIGLVPLGGARASLIGGALLATNYGFVMWNRAALMESTMTAALVCAWAAYAWSDRSPRWGAVAGVALTLAWFTKAAAAFFVGALILDLALTLWTARRPVGPVGPVGPAVLWTLTGLAISAAIVVAVFVLPHWHEYQFYNWQMTVERKPSYTLGDFQDRATWLPFVQGIFGQMFLVACVGFIAIPGIVANWRIVPPGARLLALWVLVGIAELVVHDSGNERRYVMFIPALVGLAALSWGGRETVVQPSSTRWSDRVVLFPVALVVNYLWIGTLLRPFFLTDIAVSHYSSAVKLAAALAVVLAGLHAWKWPVIRQMPAMRAREGLLFAAIAVVWGLGYFAQWADGRRYTNRDASIALGRLVPAETIIQGKLANGLALENRIRPVFVGNGFGNFEDRLKRDDARYILTYDLPSIGYESQRGSGLIQGILDHYPGHHTVASLPVDETPAPDRAVLIDKFPASQSTHAPD
jgi:4-amino-4-deoxy-L-arabinose transferase-like glycosyltransferase